MRSSLTLHAFRSSSSSASRCHSLCACRGNRVLAWYIYVGFWFAALFYCCNCRVLNLVSTRCVFFSSLSHCCCHDVPCAQNFSVEEIRVFQACLVQNPSVQVVCFENHAEWRFCLAPFVCCALLAHWRSRARLAQWRPSVLSLPLVFSVCTCALLLNIHLDSCDRTQAISFKQVISTAPPSTGL